MKQTLDVINAMETDGIIGRYAIAGAVAAYNYIEPALTNGLDILVSFDKPDCLHRRPLESIYAYLRETGYSRKEDIAIEGWSAQFLPVANPLDAEALAQAEDIEVEADREEVPVKTRVLRPEHIVANALRGGRPQDLISIAKFLQENAVDIPTLCTLFDRHGLKDAWLSFCRLTGITDIRSSHDVKKDEQETGFPDVSDIFARKAEGRRENARKTFGEKIAMMEALRERLEPFKRAREARQARRTKPANSE